MMVDIPYNLYQEVVVVGAEETGISAVITAICTLAIIGILLLKVVNLPYRIMLKTHP